METFGKLFNNSWFATILAIIGSTAGLFVIYKLLIMLLGRYEKQLESKTGNNKRSRTFTRLTGSLLRYTMFVLGIFVVLYLFGVNITSMIAGFGLVGVILSFAVQDLAKDIIRGIGIVSDSYFEVGDIIKYNGIEGEVLAIGLRTTRIRILADDNILSVANHLIEETQVVSRKNYEVIPIPYDLGVYQAEKVVKDIVTRILKNEFVESCRYIGVKELAGSSVMYCIEFTTDPVYHRQVRRDALRSIMLGMEENHIPIPFTQIDVHTIDDKARAEEFNTIFNDPQFREFVEKSRYASNDSIFRTEKYRARFYGENEEAILDGAEEFAWRMGCSRAESMQIRLLTEELMQMVKPIAPSSWITVIYRVRGKRCNVRAQVSNDVDMEHRAKLQDLATASTSTSEYSGLIGVVRKVTARFMTTEIKQEGQVWSLREYMESTALEDGPDSIDEFEKAIIMKIADDVKVSFNDNEIVIEAVKSF